jgi:hypothetical protein
MLRIVWSFNLTMRVPFNVLTGAEQLGDDVRIIYSDERGVLLRDSQIADLSEGDFAFVLI